MACNGYKFHSQYERPWITIAFVVDRQRSPDQAVIRVRDAMRERGMRWTPQRRALLELILESKGGHVSTVEMVERARRRHPETISSTVYRTLDVLEELGLVRHSHAADGREQIHVLPDEQHGHLHCRSCGKSWEIDATEAAPLVTQLAERRGFVTDLSHVSISGLCADCAAKA